MAPAPTPRGQSVKYSFVCCKTVPRNFCITRSQAGANSTVGTVNLATTYGNAASQNGKRLSRIELEAWSALEMLDCNVTGQYGRHNIAAPNP